MKSIPSGFTVSVTGRTSRSSSPLLVVRGAIDCNCKSRLPSSGDGMFVIMPPSSRIRKNIGYKVIPLIALMVCGLHLITFLPFFDEDGSLEEEIPATVDFQWFVRNPLISVTTQDVSNSLSPNYVSLSWPGMEKRRFFNNLFNSHHFWWISDRVQKLWPEFEQFSAQIKGNCSSSPKLKILMLPGVLVFTKFASHEAIKRGGPLGELTQWADLIAGCISLCHYINIEINFKLADNFLLRATVDKENASGCANDNVDLIFTDITGIKSLSPLVVKLYKNKFRILDVFGTEAAFNDPEYSEDHKITNRRWGLLDLHLRQFLTMFPHTPDNSFLGFVISSSNLIDRPKQNYTLILGKEASYLKGKMDLLKTIADYFPLAATIHSHASGLLPEGSFMLGVVDPSEYLILLSEAKVCLGLGDPIESPSPLLSLAAGCIFLNPKKNQTLYGKPTHRRVTSQHVFVERYVQPPHAYTFDPNDLEGLKSILQELSKFKHVEPIIPQVFTARGYLDNLENSLLRQNWCSLLKADANHLPLRTFLAQDSSDCKDVCYRQGLICEPHFFPQLNKLSFFESSGLTCKSNPVLRDLYLPAYDKRRQTCFLQPTQKPLFSCVGSSPPGLQRLCPCATDNYGKVVTIDRSKKSNIAAFALP